GRAAVDLREVIILVPIRLAIAARRFLTVGVRKRDTEFAAVERTGDLPRAVTGVRDGEQHSHELSGDPDLVEVERDVVFAERGVPAGDDVKGVIERDLVRIRSRRLLHLLFSLIS